MEGRRMLPGVVMAFPLWFGLSQSANSMDLFVAPDAPKSARCTQVDPCSIDAAQAKVRVAARKQREDIRVNFLDGVYRLAQPITLVENVQVSDSGRNGFKIIWQAALGARPVLSGGRPINSWTRYGDGQIWRAGLTDPKFYRNLYVNGQRAERARSRNQLDGFEITSSGYRFAEGGDISKYRNLADVELVRLWEWQMSRCHVVSATSLEIQVAKPCFDNSQRVNVGIYVENAFELLDHPGEWYLDRTGAIDGSPAVYYLPRKGEDPAKLNAILGETEQLMTLNGRPGRPLQNVAVTGLGFAHAGWFVDKSLASKVGGYSGLQAGTFLLSKSDLSNSSVVPPKQDFGFYNPENFVYLDYVPGNVSANFVRNIAFENNNFEHLGATALAMTRGIRDSRIVGNRFSDVSGSAIQLGGVEVEDHHPCGDVAACNSDRLSENNLVANNQIDGATAEYFDTLGIFVGYVRGTNIRNNRISNLAYSGISIGFGWGWVDSGGYSGFKHPTIAGNNHVTNNEIFRHQKIMADGAAIYSLGMQPGSSISGNYIHDVRPVYSGGIYLDEGSVGFTVTNNVVKNATYFLHTNCGTLSRNYGNSISENFSDNGAIVRSCKIGKTKFTERVDDNVYGSLELFYAPTLSASIQNIMSHAGLEAPYRTTDPKP